jgi:hypothetical protein
MICYIPVGFCMLHRQGFCMLHRQLQLLLLLLHPLQRNEAL